MNEKKRALKDIKKLKKIMHEFAKLGLHKKYPKIYDWVENYASDAWHFYKKKDYYSAFGAANYAYGFIDCILIIEAKKHETT